MKELLLKLRLIDDSGKACFTTIILLFWAAKSLDGQGFGWESSILGLGLFALMAFERHGEHLRRIKTQELEEQKLQDQKRLENLENRLGNIESAVQLTAERQMF